MRAPWFAAFLLKASLKKVVEMIDKVVIGHLLDVRSSVFFERNQFFFNWVIVYVNLAVLLVFYRFSRNTVNVSPEFQKLSRRMTLLTDRQSVTTDIFWCCFGIEKCFGAQVRFNNSLQLLNVNLRMTFKTLQIFKTLESITKSLKQCWVELLITILWLNNDI